MAKPSHVWGIDIGQCALKAMRCTVDGDEVVADAFDYIEYPKILSQPEADPEVLVREALEQFLSRNDVKRQRIAISVPGQSGLAKFFKPPPVDSKRIPEIVQYEAKQQIPFELEEVVWDFQKMVGGQEIDGFAIDTEVGLFAMKREQVYRALKPFDEADVELDIIQLAPLSIYNFVAFDLLSDVDPDLFDPDDPPESVVVLSMGTDATDLVITNGYRVWQRSIPLGGNHFTKQLTKELKLTFAKAEHLKRNARQAEDPKTVFQAMRPIFSDVVTEVQRSIGYFQGIDRKAQIKGVVLLGNTVKLPGLQQYVAKNLGYEVIQFDSFQRLTGSAVLSSPAFTDNVRAFGVCYGLCLQALKKGLLSTNLLPREITTQRMIRAKKPWAVASVGALMLAFAFNFIFNYSVWSEVQGTNSSGGVSWENAEGKIIRTRNKSDEYKSTQNKKKTQLEFLEGVGNEVVGAADRRLLWLELLKTIDAVLPWTPGVDPRTYVDFKKLPLEDRHELHIEYVESEYFTDLQDWWDNEYVEQMYQELQDELAEMRALEQPQAAQPPQEDQRQNQNQYEEQPPVDEGPQDAGWIVELRGHHYHNANIKSWGAIHVRNTLMRNLEDARVELPIDNSGRTAWFTIEEMGISYAVLFDQGPPRPEQFLNPEYEPPKRDENDNQQNGYAAQPQKKQDDAPEDEDNRPFFDVKKYTFTVQFCWKPQRLSERLQKQAEERAAQEAAAADAQNTAATNQET